MYVHTAFPLYVIGGLLKLGKTEKVERKGMGKNILEAVLVVDEAFFGKVGYSVRCYPEKNVEHMISLPSDSDVYCTTSSGLK